MDLHKPTAGPADATPTARLPELGLLFLRLGLTAFGGPAAHIALMESEVVQRRRWLSAERFLDLLGASNLIPGPSSTELAIFIGYERAGWRGLVVAGTCFILPAAIMVAFLAHAYMAFGTLPQVAGILYGIKPVVVAVVLQALQGLAPKALKRSVWLGMLGLAACVAFAVGTEAVLVLLGGGVASALGRRLTTKDAARTTNLLLVAGLGAGGASAAAAPVTLTALFMTFLKIGAVVFGSGYVLLAFLRADLVDRLHWLTESQLLDAVAIGQVTPGPVFTTATFIGYVIAGGAGRIPRDGRHLRAGLPARRNRAPSRLSRASLRPLAGAFLDGVNVAALALMAVGHAAAREGGASWMSPRFLIALAGAVALIRFKVSTTWLVAGGAALGMIVKAAQ